jgi:hypothetical protein
MACRGGGRGGNVEDVVTVAVIVTKKPIKGILTQLIINNAFQDSEDIQYYMIHMPSARVSILAKIPSTMVSGDEHPACATRNSQNWTRFTTPVRPI